MKLYVALDLAGKPLAKVITRSVPDAVRFFEEKLGRSPVMLRAWEKGKRQMQYRALTAIEAGLVREAIARNTWEGTLGVN